MKRQPITVVLITGLMIASAFIARAACDAAGTPADDTITCTGSSGAVDGAEGDDTIVIQDTQSGTVQGGVGDDTMTVDGTVNGLIFGDNSGGNGAGDDTIIINGTVNGTLVGDSSRSDVAAGNDTIIINGTVTGNIIGDSASTSTLIPGGDDTIIIQDGANGGADNLLTLVGVIGNDTLVFQLTMNSETDYQAAAALIAAANPANGSITINGQTYNFYLFDSLVNALIRGYSIGTPIIITVPLTPASSSVPAAPEEASDGRVNWEQRGFAPVAIYCGAGSVQVYNPTGQMLFMGSAESIIAAFAASPDVNQRVNGAEGFSLWTLNRTHELQVHADAGGYDYIFPALCVAS